MKKINMLSGEFPTKVALLKCKFCNRTFPKGYKNKKGEFVSGYSLLINHVSINHTKEFMDLQEKLDNEFLEQENI
jgi:hypothetical protein